MQEKDSKELGFSTVEAGKGYNIKQKDEVVATGIFEDWL